MSDHFVRNRNLQALWACGFGTVAMCAAEADYMWHGSKGDSPDIASVTLGSTTASAVDVFNLKLTYVETLEPNAARSERPGFERTASTMLINFPSEDRWGK